MPEVELKWLISATMEIDPARLVIPGAHLASMRTRETLDVYFDTEDLRLARWGATLRHRTVRTGSEPKGSGVWTVKLPDTDRGPQGPLMRRQEVDLPGSRDAACERRPPIEAVAIVSALTRGASLDAVTELTTRRRIRTWRRADGALVGELVDDRVTGPTVGFREIEFELGAAGDERVLDSVRRQLGRRLEREGSDAGAAAIPKALRALGDAAREPADVVVPSLRNHPTAAEVIHRSLATSVRRLLLHVPIAWLGAEIEGVHQARVATRRLRSDLATFRPFLDKAWVRELRDELRWLAAELGAVRDADVLDVRLSAATTFAGVPDEAGTEILDFLRDQRDWHRSCLVRNLSSPRANRLYDQLVEAAIRPEFRRRARRPASETLPPLVERPWRDVQAAVEELGDEPTDDELHKIRILAKRVRYAADVAEPVVGRPARRFAKAAGSVQASLGELHDAEVAAGWLRAAANDGLSASAAYEAGRVAELLRAQARLIAWRSSYDKMIARSDWIPES